LIVLVGMTAFIHYPDTVSTRLKINAINAPKVVVTRTAGNVIKLLAKEGQQVKAGETLAWMESTAKHEDVLNLLQNLTRLRSEQQLNSMSIMSLNALNFLELGELQSTFQSFYQAYLTYKSAIEGGIFLKRKAYLLKEMNYAGAQIKQIKEQQELRIQELQLATNEIEMYRKLAERRVIAPMELKRQESIYLNKQQPLQQLAGSILSNESSLVIRQKELSELENQIIEEKSKFMQALNSLISSAEAWKVQYVMTTPINGKLNYASILQENQYIQSNEELFYINPGSTDFFGEMGILQNNIGKVKVGQKVLIKMSTYPFQEYGTLKGVIKSITEVPIKDSVFLSQVLIKRTEKDSLIKLKIGMRGEAQVITDDVSLLKRLWRNMGEVIGQK